MVMDVSDSLNVVDEGEYCINSVIFDKTWSSCENTEILESELIDT